MKEVGATTGDSTIKEKLQNTEFQVIIEVSFCAKGIFSSNIHKCFLFLTRNCASSNSYISTSPWNIESLKNVFQDFLLKRVGPDNIRIKLHPSAVGLHDFDTEQNNEGALTRHDIKLQGQRLMDSKIKPKKKKQPARKK